MSLNNYKIYEAISLVFSHPFTSFGFILLLFIFTKSSLLEFMISFIFVSIVSILPTIIWSIKQGKSIFLEDRKDRSLLLFITGIVFMIGTVIGKVIDMKVFFLVSLLYAANTFALFLVNLRIKASIHIAGITGPVTYLVFSVNPLFSILYVFLIPVAYSRIKLNAHVLKEIYAGFIISFLVTLAIIPFL